MKIIRVTFLQGEKYKIISKISQGNFGITYLAEQTSLDRKVCIKEFFFRGFCERSSNGSVTISTSGQEVASSFRRKFIREAKRLSQFDHPNIVKVIDVFEENGTAYMVMDYVEGETLQQIVDRKGKLSEKEALEYIIPLCDALEVVHGQGLLHLDIKPSNILIKKQTNSPVLIDFGISKFAEASGEDHSTTTPVALTKGYAPLEQYGQDLTKLTVATDVYSIAATLYKLVTGITPPEASVIVQDGIKSPRELNPTLSHNLSAIILQSLSVKPVDRGKSIRKLKVDLQNISKMEGGAVTEANTVILDGTIQPKNKNSVVIWLTLAVVVIVIISLIVKSNKSVSISSKELGKTDTNVMSVGQEIEEENPYLQVEEMPKFPGGEIEMMKFVKNNLSYPSSAVDNGISGTVILNFVVDRSGRITQIKVVSGIGGGCDEEAVRVLGKMPLWSPGKQSGKTVLVSYTVPFKFILSDEQKANLSNNAIEYLKYCNRRFNFCIEYPKDILFEQTSSINGDGTFFKTKEGNKNLIVYGESIIDPLTSQEITLEQKYKDNLFEFSEDKSTITYKKLGKSFFVISGYNSGKIFYLKVIKCTEDGGDMAFAYSKLIYDEKEKEIYDNIANHVFNTFKISALY